MSFSNYSNDFADFCRFFYGEVSWTTLANEARFARNVAK